MHIKKLTKTECVKIIGHDFRQHKKYRNENIDTSQSNKNIIFKKCNYKDIDKYIDDNNIYVYGKNGKHKDEINYLCSVIVHYPKDCEMSENQFFKTMNEVLTKRFGNCMGSIVHYDEDTPHLHFLFMPVVYDKKNCRHKLCAKEVVNREMLQSFHSDIENDFKELGYNVKLQNDEKERGIKNIDDIEEYKKYKDLMKSLEVENQELKEKNQFLNNTNNHFKTENIELKNQNQQLKNEITQNDNALKTIIMKLKKCIDLLIKAETKDKEFLGYSPISNDVADLKKSFNDVVR